MQLERKGPKKNCTTTTRVEGVRANPTDCQSQNFGRKLRECTVLTDRKSECEEANINMQRFR
jgi:hypothetical protein